MHLRITFALAVVALSTVALAQNSAQDGPFQVKYFANPVIARGGWSSENLVAHLAPAVLADSTINFTNTGANGAGDICVNTYTFAPDEQLVSCCSCRVTRNALWHLSVNNDLLSNTLTAGALTSGLVKLLATQPTATAGNAGCVPENPGVTVQGMAAWGTNLHTVAAALGNPAHIGLTETPFTNSTLSAAERAIMTSYCGFIKLNGSHYGICTSCDFGATPYPTNPADQTVAVPLNNDGGLGTAKQ